MSCRRGWPRRHKDDCEYQRQNSKAFQKSANGVIPHRHDGVRGGRRIMRILTYLQAQHSNAAVTSGAEPPIVILTLGEPFLTLYPDHIPRTAPKVGSFHLSPRSPVTNFDLEDRTLPTDLIQQWLHARRLSVVIDTGSSRSRLQLCYWEYATVVFWLGKVVSSFSKRVAAILKARLVSVSGTPLSIESPKGVSEIFSRRIRTRPVLHRS